MLSIIVAMGLNRAIGKDGKMPWHLPGDLQYFKKLTLGKTIIMGRKTFESLPGVLPNRRHIVITANPNYSHPEIETASSLTVAIAKAPPEDETFIIGGGSIYREALLLCEKLYITEINSEYDADTFFPKFDLPRCNLMSESEIFHENGVDYKFLIYRIICAR